MIDTLFGIDNGIIVLAAVIGFSKGLNIYVLKCLLDKSVVACERISRVPSIPQKVYAIFFYSVSLFVTYLIGCSVCKMLLLNTEMDYRYLMLPWFLSFCLGVIILFIFYFLRDKSNN